ncbi:MAG: sigma-54-dependent Fis family transcriptional regulator [Planctomycetota bacterium]|nr:MAG: sigma-54-dependent Fis family transcriptional regulator [Planctomycetota bacterium]
MSDSRKGVLLVVDDEPLKRFTLQIELTEAGYTVYEAPDADIALKHISAHPIDVVISDVRMPDIDGLQLLEKIKIQSPQTHVILMTAYGSVDSAVEAIKRGAYDYLTKPFSSEVLLERLDRLLACQKIDKKAPDRQVDDFGLFAGQSNAAHRLCDQIQSLANSERDILIVGENGTKKGQVAEKIHKLSSRSQRPLIKFSCTASGSDMLEAELFGSNAGVTAGHLKLGRLELASGGTLFLDEVDALPQELQVKLLRVLEGKVIERAGSTERVTIDTRVICATSKDLRQLIDSGHFREDLYYYLGVAIISVPSLRERPEDIPILAENIMKNYADCSGGKTVPGKISPHVFDLLMTYPWPGNMRELEHVFERAIMNASSDVIQPKDVVLPVKEEPAEHVVMGTSFDETAGLTETVAGVERTLINAALRRAAGNQARAAQFLNIPRTTLRDKMAKYGLFCEPRNRE